MASCAWRAGDGLPQRSQVRRHSLAPLAIFDVTGRCTPSSSPLEDRPLPFSSTKNSISRPRSPSWTSTSRSPAFRHWPRAWKRRDSSSTWVRTPASGWKEQEDIAEQFFVKQAPIRITCWYGRRIGVSELCQSTNSAEARYRSGRRGRRLIDLSGVTNPDISYEIEGGVGNDTILSTRTRAGQDQGGPAMTSSPRRGADLILVKAA